MAGGNALTRPNVTALLKPLLFLRNLKMTRKWKICTAWWSWEWTATFSWRHREAFVNLLAAFAEASVCARASAHTHARMREKRDAARSAMSLEEVSAFLLPAKSIPQGVNRGNQLMPIKSSNILMKNAESSGLFLDFSCLCTDFVKFNQ